MPTIHHGSKLSQKSGIWQIPVLRMLAQVIHHETAAGNHLQSVGADQSQRACTSSDAMRRPRSARGVSVWVMITVDGARR
jgi:hypothetical protein